MLSKTNSLLVVKSINCCLGHLWEASSLWATYDQVKFSSQTWKVTAWKPVCIVLWRWLATWSAPSVEPMLVHTPSLSPRLCTATIVSKSPWLSLLPGMRRCNYRQSTDNVSWHWMFPSLLSRLWFSHPLNIIMTKFLPGHRAGAILVSDLAKSTSVCKMSKFLYTLICYIRSMSCGQQRGRLLHHNTVHQMMRYDHGITREGRRGTGHQ